MKYKIVLVSLLSVIVIITSCNSSEKESETTENKEVTTSLSAGKQIYESLCVSCHQKDGKGITNMFPPLAGSDFLLNNKEKAIQQIKYSGFNENNNSIEVNGKTYHSILPMHTQDTLSNQQVADVLTYILNSWGNKGGNISIKDVEETLKE